MYKHRLKVTPLRLPSATLRINFSPQLEKEKRCCTSLESDPAEARTQDPQIKSLLLYQLSYGITIYML
jgi:hypothetical protein